MVPNESFDLVSTALCLWRRWKETAELDPTFLGPTGLSRPPFE